MQGDSISDTDGLATSRQVDELCNVLRETEESWDECETQLKSATDAFQAASTTYEEIRRKIVSVQSEFDATLEEGAECPLVRKRIHRTDSQNIKNRITDIRDRLVDQPIPDQVPTTESVAEISTAMRNWQSQREEISRKITNLLPRITAYELGKAYAETRRGTQLRWHYGGIAATIVVYAVLTILSIINDSLAGMYIPLLPLSAVLFLLIQQIQQKTRMDEEYRHKETLMNTYVGFSQKLTEEDSDNLDIIAMESVARNPASTISRKEGLSSRIDAARRPFKKDDSRTTVEENEESEEVS